MSSLLGFAPFQEILITVGIYCLKIRKEKRLGFCRPTEIPASNSLVVAALKHDEVTSIRLKIREKRKRMRVGPRMLLLVFEAFSVDLRIGLRKWVGWGREADSERERERAQTYARQRASERASEREGESWIYKCTCACSVCTHKGIHVYTCHTSTCICTYRGIATHRTGITSDLLHFRFPGLSQLLKLSNTVFFVDLHHFLWGGPKSVS